MWQLRDFTHNKGSVNRFEVWGYSPNDSYEYCKVSTFCQTEAGVKWASQVLYDLAVTTIKQPDLKHEITLVSKKCTRAGINYGKFEIAALLNLKPEAAIAAMVNVGLPPETDTIVIKPGALSVGPCTYRDEGRLFAKVRFNGFSIPFYFDKEKFLEVPTEKAVTQQVGGVYAEAAFKVITDNKETLLKRALTRPLNLSGIGEYAEHNIRIMKGDGTGRYYSATKDELADPNGEIASVFSYDYYTNFAVIDDEVYKIKGFISGYSIAQGRPEGESFTNAVYNLDANYGDKVIKGYMRRSDCELLDPEDMFVREKIARSIKAKL